MSLVSAARGGKPGKASTERESRKLCRSLPPAEAARRYFKAEAACCAEQFQCADSIQQFFTAERCDGRTSPSEGQAPPRGSVGQRAVPWQPVTPIHYRPLTMFLSVPLQLFPLELPAVGYRCALAKSEEVPPFQEAALSPQNVAFPNHLS